MKNNVMHLLRYVTLRLLTFNLGSAKFSINNLSGTSTSTHKKHFSKEMLSHFICVLNILFVKFVQRRSASSKVKIVCFFLAASNTDGISTSVADPGCSAF
jgi:hypothetical protein